MKYIISNKFIYLFVLALFFYTLQANAQNSITYKVSTIKISVDGKKGETESVNNCVIVQDLEKFTTTVYKGSTKIIYTGYEVSSVSKDSTIGSIYVSKYIDNDGKECTIQQINWNKDLSGMTTFSMNYKEISYLYHTKIVEPKKLD
jgi:hypothetical protein